MIGTVTKSTGSNYLVKLENANIINCKLKGKIRLDDRKTTNPVTVGDKVDIEFRHYGEKDGLYKLYDDDGETFDYEKGAYCWRIVTMKKNNRNEWEGTISAPEKNKPNTIGKVSWKHIGN